MPSERRPMKISLSSFIYYNYTLADAISFTAQAGFDGIDIWGGRPHAYRRDLSEKETAALCRLMQDEGLAVSSFIPAQFRYPTSLCSPIDTVWSDSIRYIQDSIETAAALGAPLVSVCPGHTLHGQPQEDGFARLEDALSQVAEFAARFNLRVAIEPADRYETDLLNTCTETLKLVNRLGMPNLGVLLDNGHAYVVGEAPEQVLPSLGDKLFHIHLDDNKGQRDQHLIPGDGDYNFTPLVASLNEIRYAGFLGIELGWDYTIDPLSASKLACQRIQEILKT
jgi:fructoselysine 3-epimerase